MDITKIFKVTFGADQMKCVSLIEHTSLLTNEKATPPPTVILKIGPDTFM